MVKLSKTPGRESPSLKAGHSPAVKAGGKRVAKKSTDENGTCDKDAKRTDERPRSHNLLPGRQSVSVLLEGTLEKLGREFPSRPVSVRPAVEKSHLPKVNLIQQPRKC